MAYVGGRQKHEKQLRAHGVAAKNYCLQKTILMVLCRVNTIHELYLRF